MLSELTQSRPPSSLALEKAAMEARRKDSTYASVPLTALLEEVGPLSQGSVFVGACDDRLHFYMDLLDPRPGSVLITGERRAGQSRLLRSILASACLINPFRSLRYAYFSVDPPVNDVLLQQPHCFRVVANHTRAASELITQLADLAEKRLSPGQKQALLIVAIDGLDALCSSLDDQAYDDLAWLIQNGPSLRIWPMATLDAARAYLVGDELLQLFGTRLLGHMDARHAPIFQAEASVTAQLIPEKQFCVLFDHSWLSFWVPRLD